MEKKGQFAEVNGFDVFYVDTGGQKPLLLILHGYPSASYDYYKVLPELSKAYRVIVHDHPGFGFSAKPLDYSYSLIEQAQIILDFWQQLGVTSGHLLAHDYGTSIATEILARIEEGYQKILFKSITLSNGSVHIELAHLRLIQKLLKNKWAGPVVARLSNKKIFSRNMRNIWFNRDKLDEKELDILWELLTMNNGKKVLSKVTRYIDERYEYWDRWIGAWRESSLPAHILWAKNDPVAVAAIAEALHIDNPKAQLNWLDNLGHYPMLESPNRWVEEVLTFLGKN